MFKAVRDGAQERCGGMRRLASLGSVRGFERGVYCGGGVLWRKPKKRVWVPRHQPSKYYFYATRDDVFERYARDAKWRT